MVVVGGKQPWLSDSSQITDFLSQGLGIFDLSAMEWKDQYDAAAAPYVTPDVVKAWYTEHGQYPASWSNATVEAWFTGTAPPGSRHIVTIAAGVAGVVICLLLLGLLAYFFMSRRSKKSEGRFFRRHRSTKLEELPKAEFQKPELATNDGVAYPPKSYKSELDTNGIVPHQYANHRPELAGNGGVAYRSNMNAAELDARRQPIEKDARQVYEAPGSPKYELP
jgi:hypothetical protein